MIIPGAWFSGGLVLLVMACARYQIWGIPWLSMIVLFFMAFVTGIHGFIWTVVVMGQYANYAIQSGNYVETKIFLLH